MKNIIYTILALLLVIVNYICGIRGFCNTYINLLNGPVVLTMPQFWGIALVAVMNMAIAVFATVLFILEIKNR